MHCDIWLNFHSTPCWLRNKSSVSKIFCLVLLVYFDLKLSKAWYKIISNVFLLKIIFWSDSKMPLAKLARWLSLIVIHFKIKFFGVRFLPLIFVELGKYLIFDSFYMRLARRSLISNLMYLHVLIIASTILLCLSSFQVPKWHLLV